MSIDHRLREGLADNTRFLAPDVDRDLAVVLRRARSRRHGLVAVAVAALVALVAAVAWFGTQGRPDPDVAPAVPRPTTPRDLLGYEGALTPGEYALHVWGERPRSRPLPRAVVTVPAGYFSNGGFVLDAGREGTAEWDDYSVVQVARVDQVLSDPCDVATAEVVGPTVTDLAAALVRQSGPSTRPVPIRLDHHDGLYLEVTVPRGRDLTACTGGEYPLWRTGPDMLHAHSDRPGIVHHLWVLDVDGTRVVVDASSYPEQTPAERRELVAIAESVRFAAPTT